MKVNDLIKAVKGYDKKEVTILIKMYDNYGYEHSIDCSIDKVVCSEQGGEFESAIILIPDEDQIFEMNKETVNINDYSY